jgi:hypothetical protein
MISWRLQERFDLGTLARDAGDESGLWTATVMKIFITKNGRRKGPYSPLQLKEMLARNEISLSDRAWYEGCAEWSRIQEMPELIQAFSQAAPPKPKVRPAKSSAPFFKTRLEPFWKKFRTQKTLHLVIVCATILLALWIWKSKGRVPTETPGVEAKPVEIDVNAMQAVIKQDRDLAAAMEAKRKVVPANTDKALDTIGSLIKTYATNGLAINLSACPRDFAEAYTRLFTAWQQEAETISKHPKIPEASGPLVEGFFRNLDEDIIDTMTEPPEAMADWFDDVTSANHAVQSAQQTVQTLITRYGVRMAP